MATQPTTTFLIVLLALLGNSLVATAFVKGGYYPPKSSWNQGARSSSFIITAMFEGVETERSAVPVTPCTRICRYNANVFDGQVCIGCFRETYEIGNWHRMTATEKYYALLDAADRLENVVSPSSSSLSSSRMMMEESETGTSREELMRQADYWKSQVSS